MVRFAGALLTLACFALPAVTRAADDPRDTALAAAIEQAWMKNPKIPAYLLAASARDGKIQLFGAVETKAQKAAAVSTAKKIAHKAPIADHIEIAKIASQQGVATGAGPTAVPSQDEPMAVASTVEQAWMADKSVPYELIAAKVRGGKLQLLGAVETAAQRDAAEAIAKKNAGSLEVVNYIAVTKIASLSPPAK